jgi:hypothetical protein
MAILSQRNWDQFDVQRLGSTLELGTVIERTIGGRDFADITTVAHVIRHVESGGGLRTTRMFLDLPVRFIPRALWPDKPLNLGKEVADLFYDQAMGRTGTSGVPPSLIAELFWSFHLPGVVLGMMAFGVFARSAYEYLLRSPTNPWTVALYGVTLFYIFEQASGPFSVTVFRYLQLLVPLLFAAFFVTRCRLGWGRA